MISIDRLAFEEDSPLLHALICSDADVILTTENLEHQRFLVCLTYDMARWANIVSTLNPDLRNKCDCISHERMGTSEKAFEMLMQWVACCSGEAKLRDLINTLEQNNYEVRVSSNADESCIRYLLKEVGRLPVTDNFILEVAVRVCEVWTSLGRLLEPRREVARQQINNRTEDLVEQSCQMLLDWKRQVPTANYSTFTRALALVKAMDPLRTEDAWKYTKWWLQQLL